MAKGYVPLFFDTLEETQDLTDEEFGRLMRAVCSYAQGNEGYERFITGNEKYAFRFLKGQIDRNEEISAARAKAGATRSEQKETNESKPEQKETNESKPEQKETNESKPEREKAFRPPTLEEVRAYCKERGNKVSPERFVDFYASKGWLVGKAKMKDWKAAVRNWERDSGGTQSTKTVAAQNYNQREYGEREESPEEMLVRLQEATGW